MKLSQNKWKYVINRFKSVGHKTENNTNSFYFILHISHAKCCLTTLYNLKGLRPPKGKKG